MAIGDWQLAAAARELKAQISASVERVASGSRLVQDAGSTMAESVGGIPRMSDIIGEISAATAEQRKGIGSVNRAVTQRDGMSQQNAALVEKTPPRPQACTTKASQLAVVIQAFSLSDAAA